MLGYTAEEGDVYTFVSGSGVAGTTGTVNITVDSALDTTSKNPVENRAIEEAFRELKLYGIDDGNGNVTLLISRGMDL